MTLVYDSILWAFILDINAFSYFFFFFSFFNEKLIKYIILSRNDFFLVFLME
jgi:hypothetical protein